MGINRIEFDLGPSIQPNKFDRWANERESKKIWEVISKWLASQ